MRSVRLALGVLAVACLPRVSSADELLVFAAASVSDALGEIGRQFTVDSSHHVAFSFGASSDLGRQIKAGAPADLLLSADLATLEGLAAAGKVERGAVKPLLSNQLVVIVPAGSSRRIARPEELRDVRRLALADPEAVPAGVYAQKWLASLGLWEAVRGRVVPALDVRAALAAVETGAVDAGIVYRTDALGSKRVRVAFEVPRESGPRITYAAAPVAGARHAAAAAAFLRFLGGAAARAVFTRYGFIVL
jgi:molybdate transport system substrate-binding protein